MVISKVLGGQEKVLAKESVPIPAGDRPALLKFANVDHRLVLEFGSQKISYDLGREPNDVGPRKTDIPPKAGILGAGKLWLSHIALFRDIHYTDKSPHSNSYARATEGNPLTLAQDQFFVLGDNSPRSEDGRWWDRPGKGNFGHIYPEGIVPREYLVGKALFVYWPAGFGAFPKSRFAMVPNIGQLRFIYGGSDRIE
jgi:signal peptidase I